MLNDMFISYEHDGTCQTTVVCAVVGLILVYDRSFRPLSSSHYDTVLFRSASNLFGQRDFNLELVHLLVRSHCDVNIADKFGITPLYQAAAGGETGELSSIDVVVQPHPKPRILE